jgi:hypothetical protein
MLFNSINMMMFIYNLILVVAHGGFGVTVIEKMFWFIISLVSMLFRLALRLLKTEKEVTMTKLPVKVTTRKGVKYEEVEEDEVTDDEDD